ncbi:MAG: NAD(P)/FAD-dependent oxidoreductase, partial [Deltaproteobacteria bacterium]|nr:NAD(P)/FAD-dependent oxidoreductase [Deltaproteobacteria bacterium]
FPETKRLFSVPDSAAQFSELSEDQTSGRLSFTESIYLLDRTAHKALPENRTIIFYNLSENFIYHRPEQAVDLNSGVICFPDNFEGIKETDIIQVRVTHLANYNLWRNAYEDEDKALYKTMKTHWTERSKEVVGKIIGNYSKNIVYEDTFTPVTVERYTSRSQGAVYGSPEKIKDVVGSMLSGVTMVNQHILNKI